MWKERHIYSCTRQAYWSWQKGRGGEVDKEKKKGVVGIDDG
jgi:hypothetical protein